MHYPDSDQSSIQDEIFTRWPSVSSATGASLSASAITKRFADLDPEWSIWQDLARLYDKSVAAKIFGVAEKLLLQDNSFTQYPEWVLADGDHAGSFQKKPARFWTCGFFPGSLYSILERNMKYPKHLPLPVGTRAAFQTQLLDLCRSWSKQMHTMALRNDTHDLGFITMPSLCADWELTGNAESLSSIIRAAENLSSRWSPVCSAIRSWNQIGNKCRNITDMSDNFLIIVDSMCNLDLLFYAGHQTGDLVLIERATAHAHAVLKHLVRPDGSTYHVANLNPSTGKPIALFTHQGFADQSAWARGQGWAILGFAQTYHWTKDPVFLQATIKLADYFLSRLESSGNPYPYVPPWDFDAPNGVDEPRDTSAGMAAANGLLLLHQALQAQGETSVYLSAVHRIVQDTLDFSLAEDSPTFHLSATAQTKLEVSGIEFDALLMHSTANNNEFANQRYADVGIVYADYYFLELGNKLLRMGLV